MRKARWHVAKALEHRQTAEDLAAEFLAQGEEGGGDEQAIKTEVAELLASLEAEVSPVTDSEMEDDPYDRWTVEWWHRKGKAEFAARLKRAHTRDLKVLLKKQDVRDVEALKKKVGVQEASTLLEELEVRNLKTLLKKMSALDLEALLERIGIGEVVTWMKESGVQDGAYLPVRLEEQKTKDWLEAEEREQRPPHESGGKKRADEAEKEWAPWVAKYRQMRDEEGLGPDKAREIIKSEWEREHGEQISYKTLERHCQG